MAEDGDGAANEQPPLRGTVLCCTSLAQDVRTKVSDVVVQMGAVHEQDLKTNVTHLIVGNIATPKYRYVAKERPDIKVLHPDWVEAVRQAWMAGDDFDIHEMEEQHCLPTFFGLRICVTGFDDLEQRGKIADTVASSGAEYHGDLTKAVTHLIAAVPQGSKYTHAKQWGTIKVVSLKWFQDSMQRGMALDESLYDPSVPFEEQGRGAYRTFAKPGKRLRDAESQSMDDLTKRKLRRTASTRLNSQSQDMWQDISAREGTLECAANDQWKEESREESREQSDVQVRPKVQVRQSDVFKPVNEIDAAEDKLLSGRYVFIHGFNEERTARLRKFLEPNGAVVMESPSALEDASCDALFQSRHILLPHAPDGPLDVPDVPAGTLEVTEWWVERCVHHNRYCDPMDDPLCRPLWRDSISGLTGVTINTTGFSGVDLRQIAKAVTLVGAVYEETLIPRVSVLISGSATIKKEKAFYATKHNIPVVSVKWLNECLNKKQKVAFDGFHVDLPPLDPNDIAMREASTSSPAASAMRERPSIPVKRESQGPKRLSSIRKKHATPSLPLQLDRLSSLPPRPANPAPFIHEDDDDATTLSTSQLPQTDGPMSQPRSQPLQELSPNLSPRKPTPSDSTDHQLDDTEDLKPIKQLTPPQSPGSRSHSPQKAPTPRPAPRDQETIAAELATLLHHQKSSRLSSAGPDTLPTTRKSRPLGRSTSGIGLRQSPSKPTDTDSSTLLEADGYNFSHTETFPHATQIGYETEDATTHRAAMEKRMNVKLDDEESGRRVASVGTVKDCEDRVERSGVGGRVKAAAAGRRART